VKIAISYPPLESDKGVPLLSQNRQFQWFRAPTYIYPVVPAQAASLLRSKGFDVIWDDAIAEGKSYRQWLRDIREEKPDLIAIETKTPVVKRHWNIIREIKNGAGGEWRPAVVMMGDHVTALPLESMENSDVDFVITGGDYDFLLLSLCQNLVVEPGGSGLRIGNPGNLEPGIWYRQGKEVRNTGDFKLDHDLNSLPFIDRDLTQWRLYAEKNGNFKYTPGTYVMAGRDCWWGRCDFCSWTTLYPGRSYRTVTPERHLDEIGRLIDRYRVREIFDDSGCFPRGEWLEEFCRGVIERGYHKRVTLGCNMRVGGLAEREFRLMKEANFRFILIGLESVSQDTLDRLHKGIRVEQITETCRMAKEAGLEPHITVMVGYPWETREDAFATIRLAREMFKRGHIDTLQATIVVPYPGTPMFEEARRKGWLLTEDWDRYDMRESVWKSPVSSDEVLRLTQDLYKAALTPRFLARKLLSVRNLDDLRFLWRAGLKVMGHLADFGRQNLSDERRSGC